MTQKTQKTITEMSSKEIFDLYFERIRERQRLEAEYYRTGNKALFADIAAARERIREALRALGINC